MRDMAAVVEHCDSEIERLKSIIKQLQRSQFGRGSEWIDPDQLVLASSPAIILFADHRNSKPSGMSACHKPVFKSFFLPLIRPDLDRAVPPSDAVIRF